MDNNELKWNKMDLCGTKWISLEQNGSIWNKMDECGAKWINVE